MLPGAFIYRAYQRHQPVVPGPLINEVPQGAYNAYKDKTGPLQFSFFFHSITGRSVCGFWVEYTVRFVTKGIDRRAGGLLPSESIPPSMPCGVATT